MKKIGGKNIAPVGFPTIISYLASNLTAVGLSIIIKLDEKFGAILLNKIYTFKNNEIQQNVKITSEFNVIVHKSKVNE